jgi:hypothetical protein
MWRLVWLPLVILAVRAGAQPTSGLPGPLACFLSVTQTNGLDNGNARQLCIGAVSAEPARCYDGLQRLGGLTNAQSVQVCAGATDGEAPVRCMAHLGDTSGYVTADLVSYCQALHWPLVAPPNGGSPACIDDAQATGFSDTQILDLCRGSTSSEPAECARRGRTTAGLSDGELVSLCAPAVQLPYGVISGGTGGLY